jgi:hypothetical protein
VRIAATFCQSLGKDEPGAPGLGMTVNVARLKNYLVDLEIRVNGQVIYRTPNLD